MQTLFQLLATEDDLFEGLLLALREPLAIPSWNEVSACAARLSPDPVREACDRATLQLRSLAKSPLTEEHVRALESKGAQGVYLLYHREVLIYVGKADNKKGVPQRLLRHIKKLRHRAGISLEDVSFKALFIEHVEPGAVERALIERVKSYRAHVLKSRMDWNRDEVDAWLELDAEVAAKKRKRLEGFSAGTEKDGLAEMAPLEVAHLKKTLLNDSGFGSNDPGKNRDHQEASDFDLWYPLNLDESWSVEERLATYPFQLEADGRCTLARLTEWFRDDVGITFRLEGKGTDSCLRDLRLHPAECLRGNTLLEVLRQLARQLPSEFCVVALAGRVVITRGTSLEARALCMIRCGGMTLPPVESLEQEKDDLARGRQSEQMDCKGIEYSDS